MEASSDKNAIDVTLRMKARVKTNYDKQQELVNQECPTPLLSLSQTGLFLDWIYVTFACEMKVPGLTIPHQ